MRANLVTDYTPKKSRASNGVNVPGPGEQRWVEPGMTATVSLLSEGLVYCSECGGRIDGLAVYVTRERKDRRSGYELVALLHPGCYSGEVA